MQEQGFSARGYRGGEQAPGNPRPRQPFQASQAQVAKHLNEKRTDMLVLSFDYQILMTVFVEVMTSLWKCAALYVL